MPFFLSIILYSVFMVYSFTIHWGISIFAHICPSLFFMYLVNKKFDFYTFLTPFYFSLLLLPIINWGFLGQYLSIKKMRSSIYNEDNQKAVFKQYEHSFMVRVAIKNKSKSN